MGNYLGSGIQFGPRKTTPPPSPLPILQRESASKCKACKEVPKTLQGYGFRV